MNLIEKTPHGNVIYEDGICYHMNCANLDRTGIVIRVITPSKGKLILEFEEIKTPNTKEKEVMEVIHGKDFNAIHCGPSRDHKCDHNGPGVMLLNDTPFEVADNPENRIKYGPLQNGASVNCSVCGRSALSNAMWEGP